MIFLVKRKGRFGRCGQAGGGRNAGVAERRPATSDAPRTGTQNGAAAVGSAPQLTTRRGAVAISADRLIRPQETYRDAKRDRSWARRARRSCMDGIDLAGRAWAQWPQIRILLPSGYSHVLGQDAHHGFDLLRKPHSSGELSAAIQAVLAGFLLRS